MSRRDVDDWFWHVGIELSRMSDELSRARPSIATGRCWEPKVDVIEETQEILVRAEIAGVRGEDIGLAYLPDRHAIVFRGVRLEQEEGDGSGRFHQLEIPFGEFEREVRLPDVSIRSNEIRAQYKNGFLLIVIPKADRVVISRTVPETSD